MQKIISIVIPIFNEEQNIPLLTERVISVLSATKYDYELIFVDDGSIDGSANAIDKLTATNPRIKSLELSKNFGKESATSAGIHVAIGDAVIMIDADLQHPPELIRQLIEKWEAGADVVIGVRTKNKDTDIVKKIGSFFYYKIINSISDTYIKSGSTDFRLLDRKVVDEFNKFTEHDRITRGLIDWLGFRREYVEFVADKRLKGKASYSKLKLVKLALSSSVSHSFFPLKIAGYLGAFILTVFGIGGLIVFTELYVFHDYFKWHIVSTAQLAILMIFFIGVVLACLGLVAIYIGSIKSEVSNRPLYIVREKMNIK